MPKRQTHYMIIDCNSFYASVEKIFRPELRNSPVVVLSNNDGIIVALSQEAKDVGLKRGDAIFKVSSVVNKHKVAVFSSNYVLYYEISKRIEAVVNRYYVKTEKYSIDELFVEYTTDQSPEKIKEQARRLRHNILKEVKVTVSVGIASTKTLAKVMNRYAKKDKRYKGVAMLKSKAQLQRALQNFDVSDVWGVGRKHSKSLNSLGIKNAWDFSQMNANWVKKNYTITGLRTVNELRGIPNISMEYARADKKNIMCSRSFGQPISTLPEMKAAIADYVQETAEKLRNQGSVCKSLSVFLLTDPFKKRNKQYRNSIHLEMPYAANDNLSLQNIAFLGLERIFRAGYIYKKAGVAVFDLISEENIQYTLWDNTEKIFDFYQLFKKVDIINTSIGTLKFAVQNKKGRHRMRQNKKSPEYTTKISDVPKIDMDKKIDITD